MLFQYNNNTKELLRFLLNHGVIDVSEKIGSKQYAALELAEFMNKKIKI